MIGRLQLMIWNRWISREADFRSAMLRRGALATAILYACLAIVAGPLGVFIWFAPAMRIGLPVLRIADDFSDFWPAFGWTLICGAQTALVVWLCGRAFYRRKGPTA
jgi:hypothetical protein